MADVVYFVKDLLFSSKIREVAAQVGVTVEPFREAKGLAQAAKSARLIFLDLRMPEALEALDLIALDADSKDKTTVGFIDHEKLDVMDDATRRGCKKVMAKGQFTQKLPELISALV